MFYMDTVPSSDNGCVCVCETPLQKKKKEERARARVSAHAHAHAHARTRAHTRIHAQCSLHNNTSTRSVLSQAREENALTQTWFIHHLIFFTCSERP